MDEKQNTDIEQQAQPAPTTEAGVPSPEASTTTQEGGAKPPFGPVVGTVIVVVILAIGGFYIWGAGFTERQEQAENPNAPTAEEIANEEDPVVQSLEAQGTADDVASLEAELDATGLDALDEDLANIDAEF